MVLCFINLIPNSTPQTLSRRVSIPPLVSPSLHDSDRQPDFHARMICSSKRPRKFETWRGSISSPAQQRPQIQFPAACAIHGLSALTHGTRGGTKQCTKFSALSCDCTGPCNCCGHMFHVVHGFSPLVSTNCLFPCSVQS